MSYEVFPTLPGLAWDVKKVPIWSTTVYTARAGYEQRVQHWSYPRYRFSLQYEVLREGAGYGEVESLAGFFNRHAGMALPFYYEDPTDNSVTDQAIATGDGSTKTFQLVRSYGGHTMPTRYIKSLTNVKVGGVTTAVSLNSVGAITFTTAPANGAAITATFTYYFLCRFDTDEMEFNYLAKLLWDARSVQMMSLK